MSRKLKEEHDAKLTLEQQATQIAEENKKLQVQKELAERNALQQSQIQQQQFNYRSSVNSSNNNDANSSRSSQDMQDNHHEDVIDQEEEQAALFSSEGVTNMDSELNRKTAVAQDKSLNTKLKELSNDLNAVREQKALSDHDKIHQDNVKQGRDKYKTLNLIRKGNTKSRVNEFEAM